MTDSLLDFQKSEIAEIRAEIADVRQKHEDCLERESHLRTEVRHLTERVDELSDVRAIASEQRQLKHDWRSFAGSLFLERATVQRFLADGQPDQAARVLATNEELRANSPLLDDIQQLLERDEP